MIANYHTHTYRCHHASGVERDYIEKAIAEVRITKENIKGIMNTLRNMQSRQEAEVHSLREQMAKLVME